MLGEDSCRIPLDHVELSSADRDASSVSRLEAVSDAADSANVQGIGGVTL
jgi:hypothetical protein